MLLIFLSFWSGFEWYPLSFDEVDKGIYSMILESEEGASIIRKYGGEENIVRCYIILDGSVFKGGGTVLLPERYKILKVPEELKLIRRSININKFKRYTALYEEGELKEKWVELIKESEDVLNISSLDEISPGKLGNYFPDRIYNKDKDAKGIGGESNEKMEEEEIEKRITLPAKHYFSFILVEEGWREKLIPVLLHLSPLDERIYEIQMEEG